MEHANSHQLFNISWTIHRLSPLHHGKDCETLLNNQVSLETYATRLREHLTGDAVVGVEANTSTHDSELSKTGSLKNCLWQPISPSRETPTTENTFSGIMVTLEYETIVYKAALLTDTLSDDRKGSTSLPLLLTRFPTGLRQTFLAFLSTNFDTHVSPLRLSSSFLCEGLQTYMYILERAQAVDVIKELQLTLSFSPSIAPDLKSLNVTISRAALEGFLNAQAPTGNLRQQLRSPLVANLTSYLEEHLAMNLDLDAPDQAKQHVRLSKLVCAAFVLGGEGRVKLVVADQNNESGFALEAGMMLLRLVARKAIIGGQSTIT